MHFILSFYVLVLYDIKLFPKVFFVLILNAISVSKTTTELNLKWSDISPVKLYDKLKLPQFLITNVSTSLCKETFHIGE